MTSPGSVEDYGKMNTFSGQRFSLVSTINQEDNMEASTSSEETTVERYRWSMCAAAVWTWTGSTW